MWDRLGEEDEGRHAMSFQLPWCDASDVPVFPQVRGHVSVGQVQIEQFIAYLVSPHSVARMVSVLPEITRSSLPAVLRVVDELAARLTSVEGRLAQELQRTSAVGNALKPAAEILSHQSAVLRVYGRVEGSWSCLTIVTASDDEKALREVFSAEEEVLRMLPEARFRFDVIYGPEPTLCAEESGTLLFGRK